MSPTCRWVSLIDTDNRIGVIIQHDLFVPTGAYRVRTGANSAITLVETSVIALVVVSPSRYCRMNVIYGRVDVIILSVD